MQGILYEEPSFLQFLFVTVIMVGRTAWRTGKSLAEIWRFYRTRQMTNIYYWLYEKASPFSWKAK